MPWWLKVIKYDIYGSAPDNKVQGANMGPTWVLSAPDGPHVPCYQGGSV